MTSFKILEKDGKARVGELKTPRGVIQTPNFIPVGTQATVKAMSPRDLKEVGVQVVLANTYHLMLRPGEETIKKLGGLHKFMGWPGPIMTDSGGFQVFSLGVALEHGVGKLLREQSTGDSLPAGPLRSEASKAGEQSRPRLNKITEEGVIFQSHLDGSRHLLTPEKSIEIQLKLDSDLMVAFDDLESPKHTYQETLKSLELIQRWELRSLKRFNREKSNSLLYGVTHGGIFEDLRVRSAKFVDQNFAGIALGGAHKDKKTLYQVIDRTVDNVSSDKPRHLLGIGEIEDILEAVARGIDLFDCSSPTRRARNGSLYTKNGLISIGVAKFSRDKNPIDKECDCFVCASFSLSYLRHLFTSRELLFYQLATYHNLYFVTTLMAKIREKIANKQFHPADLWR